MQQITSRGWQKTMHLAWLMLIVGGVQAEPVQSEQAPVYISPHTGIAYQHGYAFLSQPKYGSDATHFDYVNPDAPKGGTYRFREMGNWDSFNPIPLRGRLVVGAFYWVKEWRYLWDSLMRDALDEPATYYGLIAQGIAVEPEGKWIAFKLRENARWHDGEPLTVEDVVYTYDVSTTIANAEITQPLKPYDRIEVVGPYEV
jgi:microcin C transport system substrate-binding protein